MKFLNRRSPAKAVFELHVDFKREYKEKYGELCEGNSYYLHRKSNTDNGTKYEDIQGFISSLVEEELKKHLAKTVGIEIAEIRVTNNYRGSIELVFVVLFNAYQFIAGMKDFYDNVRLIRNQSAKYIRHRLEDRYGSVFDVSANVEYPSIDRHDDLFWLFHKGGMPFPSKSSESSKRDGLFYYLLVSNIVLLAIVVLLVYRAVKSYYGF